MLDPTHVYLLSGDCQELLKTIPDNVIDSLITDPPAGISFMGKDWDSNKGGRDQWISWLTDVMQEVYRVLKPGAHGLVWALPRTSHWTATALENAGFEIRDVVTHHFGSGFPKSLNISKSIDGVLRKQSGGFKFAGDDGRKAELKQDLSKRSDYGYVYSPVSEDGKKWEGWGTALKPASEHWILIRKPLNKKTIVDNVITYGTGAINIDSCRIKFNPNDDPRINKNNSEGEKVSLFKSEGRWPANVILTHSEYCELIGTKKVKGTKEVTQGGRVGYTLIGTKDGTNPKRDGKHPGFADKDGMETVEEWDCVEGCPIRELDNQSGVSKRTGKTNNEVPLVNSTEVQVNCEYNDQGGASRFFYCAKPSPSEKKDNNHPTVKSIKLMEYLIKLVTPENGICLDPFMGSGSTGVACVLNDFKFVGIEEQEEYYNISISRLEKVWDEKHV